MLETFSGIYLGYEAEGGREKEDRFLGKHGKGVSGLYVPTSKPQSPVAGSQGLS